MSTATEALKALAQAPTDPYSSWITRFGNIFNAVDRAVNASAGIRLSTPNLAAIDAAIAAIAAELGVDDADDVAVATFESLPALTPEVLLAAAERL